MRCMERSQRWRLAGRTIRETMGDGFRRRRWISTPRRWRRGSAWQIPICRRSSPISRISRRRISDSWRRSDPRDFAAQNCDRSFRQREHGLCRSLDRRLHRWPVGIGVRTGVGAVPHVLFAAKRDHPDRTGKMSHFATAFKLNANGMRFVSIFIDEQQSPFPVRTSNRVARDQRISGRVFDSAIHTKKMMNAAAMRDPFVVDHPPGVIEGGVTDEFVVAIQKRIAPDRPALATMLYDAGFDRRMNVQGTAFRKKTADVIGQPQ